MILTILTSVKIKISREALALSQLPGVLFYVFSTAAKDSESNLIHES